MVKVLALKCSMQHVLPSTFFRDATSHTVISMNSIVLHAIYLLITFPSSIPSA